MTGTGAARASHTDRLGVVREDAEGTPAAEWAAWDRRFEPLDLTGWDDVLVVAPHPDDEVLGVGGLMSHLVSLGAQVEVAAVTDGSAAYPHSRSVTPTELAHLRVRESQAACAVLGVDPPRRLGLPDGDVARQVPQLELLLAELLRPGMHCLATWAADGHPDHEAVGRAATAACRRSGAVLVEYPVWMWHWASPDDRAVPWHRARVLALPPEVHRAKRRAVAEFASQISPLSDDPADAAVLPPFVLERLVRDHETVLV